MPSILMRSEAWNDGATTENAIRNPKTIIVVCARRPNNKATPWRFWRLNANRLITVLVTDATIKNRIKTRIARKIFGRSEMVPLMILAPDFHALDKSIGMAFSSVVFYEGGIS